jgi:hypothetical protein
MFVFVIGLTREKNGGKIGIVKEHHYRSCDTRIVMPF